ncbi:hypothetical protein BH23VER1_BH23VER1_12670 [soil metagenome]
MIPVPSVGVMAWGVAAAMAASAGPAAPAVELRWDARALFELAVTDHIALSEDGGGLVLQEGILIEDDGPAAGYSYLSNQEHLSNDVWIKKELVIPNPKARRAYLLLGMNGGSSEAHLTVNGQAVVRGGTEATKHLAGSYWDTHILDPELLRPGTNEIVVGGSGSIWIARDDEFAKGSRTRTAHPNRSAKSTDGGETWSDDGLGESGGIDGEYYVRVFLEQYQPKGSLLLPVVDAGNLEGHAIAAPLAGPLPFRVSVSAETGPAGAVSARVRTGSSYVPDTTTWSDWEVIAGAGGSVASPRGRYFQLAIDLTTGDPRETPELRQVSVSASGVPRQWTDQLTVVESHNERIVRTSIPFKYEPFDHPKLRALRHEYGLDQVVEGSSTEFELITRLAAWASQQWERGHLGESYPTFDALDILKIHPDGTPVGGFCQQYNIVFLQACESFGLVGRSVSLGTGRMVPELPKMSGHEVTEIWSNEFKKWVYVDGDEGVYLQDAASNAPMSLMELRERKMAAARDRPFAPVNFVKVAATRSDWTGMDGMPPAYELRLIPRSNYFQEASPLPLNQGMRGWFWTGHYVWTDGLAPASLLYGHRVAKRQNFDWTLNQAHYVLEATKTPGELRVHLDTETPGFETFLAAVDGGGKRPVASGFLWKLQAGPNRLEVLPRNSAGREGISSWIVVEYEQGESVAR